MTQSREDFSKKNFLKSLFGRGRPKREPSEETSSWSVTNRQTHLVLQAKNLTIRPMPEGRLEWTVLIEKVYGGVERYSGVAAMPALRSLRAEEILLGPFPVGETRTSTGIERDRVEHRIVITLAGEEFRTVSCQEFDNLDSVARRHFGDDAGGEIGNDRRGPRKPDNLVKLPDPVQPPVVPDDVPDEKMPPQPPKPIEVAKPAVETPPAPVVYPPFDFFNLERQKSAAAN